MKKYSIFILLSLFLTSCATTNSPAPVIYHHLDKKDTDIQTDSRERIKENHKTILIDPNDRAKKIRMRKPIADDERIIYHESSNKESLRDIAKDYKVNLERLAEYNDIKKPYKIEDFQLIKIPKDLIEEGDLDISSQEDGEVILSHNQPVKNSRYIWPARGEVITKFGKKTAYGISKGIDIKLESGTKIITSRGGKVIYAGYDAIFGNLVLVKVPDSNIIISYAHMDRVLVAIGEKLNQSDLIGYSGSSGKTLNAQLHFGIREGKDAKDPLIFLKK